MGILTNIGVAIVAVIIAMAFIYQPTTLPNLPPGTTGYPLIGETVNLFQQPQSWFVERMAQDGPLSKTFFLGQDLILMMGLEGARLFYDTSRITRVDAHPHYTYAALPNNVAYQDEHGAQFKITKKLLLKLTDPAEIEKFFPTYIQQAQAFFKNLTISYNGASFCMVPHLKTFYARTLGHYMFGTNDLEWENKFLFFYMGITQPPIQIPTNAFSKAVNSVPTLIEWYAAQIAAHRANPSEYDDALSRLLLRDPEFKNLSVNQLAHELHAAMASAILVFTIPTNLIYTLALHPDIVTRLRAEIRSASSQRQGPLQLSSLQHYPYLDLLVKESQRYNPNVRYQFARVRETFNYTVKGTGKTYTLYKGFPVALPFHTVHKDPAVYQNPNEFLPERFKDADDKYNAELYTFIPNGGGNPATQHTCIGVQFTRILAKGVLIVLFGEYDWTVAFPKYGYFAGATTPTPLDHMYVHKFRQV